MAGIGLNWGVKIVMNSHLGILFSFENLLLIGLG